MSSNRKETKQDQEQDLVMEPATSSEPDHEEPEATQSGWKSFGLLGAALAVMMVLVFVGIRQFRSHPQLSEGETKSTSEAETKAASVKSSDELVEDLAHRDFSKLEKQVAEKIRDLAKQAKENPGSAFNWGKLGMNLDIHDFKKDALVAYKKAAELNDQDFRWNYYPALILYDTGSPAEAAVLFEKAIALKPDYAPAHLRYGRALYETKHVEQARIQYQKALESNPDFAHAYFGLAQIAMDAGQVEEAGKNLSKALQITPRYGEAHGLLSQVYRKLNRPEEAERELNISQQLPKKAPLDDEITRELVDEGVSSYWHEVRGRAYLQQKRYEEAAREMEMAVQAANDPRYLDTLGIIYQYMGRNADAVQQHRKAVELNPQSASIRNNLASALIGIKKDQEAIQELEKAISAQPDFSASYFQLARIYLLANNKAKAIETFRRGHQAVPQDSRISLQLAWLQATAADPALRNEKEAVQLAELACPANQPRDPECLVVLAATYGASGQFEQAISLAQQARKMAEDSDAKQIVERIDTHLARYRAGQPYRE